jgi:hypothetical protein
VRIVAPKKLAMPGGAATNIKRSLERIVPKTLVANTTGTFGVTLLSFIPAKTKPEIEYDMTHCHRLAPTAPPNPTARKKPKIAD